MKSNRLYPDEQALLEACVKLQNAPHNNKKAWRDRLASLTSDYKQAKREREGHPFKLRKGREAA